MIKNKPSSALKTFNQYTDMMCISSITEAELVYGAEKSQRPEHNLKIVADFVSQLEVLEYDSSAAAHYGNIRFRLEQLGKPIGVNDIHIAAHARSHGLIVVTNNQKEFDKIEGLRLESWIA